MARDRLAAMRVSPYLSIAENITSIRSKAQQSFPQNDPPMSRSLSQDSYLPYVHFHSSSYALPTLCTRSTPALPDPRSDMIPRDFNPFASEPQPRAPQTAMTRGRSQPFDQRSLLSRRSDYAGIGPMDTPPMPSRNNSVISHAPTNGSGMVARRGHAYQTSVAAASIRDYTSQRRASRPTLDRRETDRSVDLVSIAEGRQGLDRQGSGESRNILLAHAGSTPIMDDMEVFFDEVGLCL